MHNQHWGEIIFGIILVVFGIILANPGMFFMPSMFFMMLIAVFALIFFIFAGFVWKESSRDEREELHKLIAGRIAFLVGVGVLTLGIIVQGITHSIDPWLVAALTLMVLAKLTARAALM
jgi:hypothetical protein